MSWPAGKPRPLKEQSVPGKIRNFFAQNPDEMLTYEDVVIKFGITRKQAIRAVGQLSREGRASTVVMIVAVPRVEGSGD